MKKQVSFMAIMILTLSLSSCAKVAGGMANVIADAYGVETEVDFEEQYQQQLEQFADDVGKLEDILKEEIRNGEDTASDIDSEPAIRWESITEDDKVTLGNITDESGYTDYYNKKFSKGQCTWYAYGRFYETTDIDINISGDAKTWLDNCDDDRVSVERDLAKIQPHSIAVDYKTTDSKHPGHVTYIEHVTYDENGNPVDVYFTESNWDSNNVYNEGVDGIVKKLSYENFINRGNHKVIGYIVPK